MGTGWGQASPGWGRQGRGQGEDRMGTGPCCPLPAAAPDPSGLRSCGRRGCSLKGLAGLGKMDFEPGKAHPPLHGELLHPLEDGDE